MNRISINLLHFLNDNNDNNNTNNKTNDDNNKQENRKFEYSNQDDMDLNQIYLSQFFFGPIPCLAAEWTYTRNLKVPRVRSEFGDYMILLSQIHLWP